MPSVAVYCRLSIDDGQKESTARQEAACRQYAALRDWTVAAAYVDRDTSAYDRRVVRPEFERLLVDVALGRLNGVVVWKLDRLVRRGRDWERFWDACEARGVFLASCTEPIDTTSDLGVTLVQMLTSFAQLESATISTRVKAAKQSSRSRGEPNHGGHRGFGHERDGTIRLGEAEEIQDAVRTLLTGGTLTGIARDWAQRGVVTPTGRPWGATHLGRMLRQARLAGAREHADGSWTTTGAITPIVSEGELRQVRAILADPARRTNRLRVANALLTGVAWCECGNRLTTGKVRDRRMYACRARPDMPGCGRVSVSQVLADEHVAGLVLDAIDIDAVRRALAQPVDDPAQAIAQRLAGDRAALERLAVDRYTRVITEAEHGAARAALLDRIHDAEHALARHHSADLVLDTDVRGHWADADPDWQRRLVRVLVRRITVSPARRPYSVWNPERLAVEWTFAQQSDDLGDHSRVT